MKIICCFSKQCIWMPDNLHGELFLKYIYIVPTPPLLFSEKEKLTLDLKSHTHRDASECLKVSENVLKAFADPCLQIFQNTHTQMLLVYLFSCILSMLIFFSYLYPVSYFISFSSLCTNWQIFSSFFAFVFIYFLLSQNTPCASFKHKLNAHFQL